MGKLREILEKIFKSSILAVFLMIGCQDKDIPQPTVDINPPWVENNLQGDWDCKLAPPMTTELPKQQEKIKLEFIESRIVLTSDDGGKEERFSLWMPNRDILDGDWIMVSRPGIITYESVMFARDLMRSM